MHLRHLIKVLLSLALLGLGTAAQAADGAARLETFLDGLTTMRAQFVQSVMEPDGTVVEQSEGELLVARPGRFRLEYVKPYRQTYVADGEKVWMYDRDLEQVTVKEQDMTLGSTPAMLLSEVRPLAESFRVVELGEHEGFTWLELRPLANDATFDYVRLALEPKTLRAMEMVDGFGQVTRLFFDSVTRNPELKSAAFTFEPPPGVDVIGEQ